MTLAEPGEIGLGRDKDEQAENERDDQAQDAFSQVLDACASLKREKGSGAGDDEQQRHTPGIQKGAQHGQGRAGGGILHIVRLPDIEQA